MTNKKASTSTFTCEICIEPALLTQKFHHKNSCFHNFCVMCIAGHIKSKINESVPTITCPGFECTETLDPIECQPLIPPHLFIRWLDALCMSAVSGSKTCYCPNRDCSELMVDECDGAVEKCECPRCKTLLCFKCRVSWHSGFRCSENHEVMDSNDREFGCLLEKMNWNRCPNCGQPVDRLDGCHTVVCRCGKSFCHKCGGEPHIYGRCVGPETRGRRRDFETYCMYLILILLVLVTFCFFYYFVDVDFDLY